MRRKISRGLKENGLKSEKRRTRYGGKPRSSSSRQRDETKMRADSDQVLALARAQ